MDEHILIVDDEKAIVFALEEALLDDGYTVATAHTAEDGFALFQQSPASVVLTDMKMPGMSGIELLGKIRNISTDTQVIIITAYGTFDSAVEAVRLGAFDYLQKPFNIQEVKNLVRKAIDVGKAKRTFAVPMDDEEISEETKTVVSIKDAILPDGEKMLGRLCVDVKSVPKETVGADFYDYFDIADGKVVLTIGDVSEKGVDGSLFMIMVKSLIRSEASHSTDPIQILTRVNTLLRQQGVTIAITVFLAVLDLKTGHCVYVNAGHERPLYISSDGAVRCTELAGSDTFIGVFDNVSFQVHTCTCAQHDLLLLYTDGLIRMIERNFPQCDAYAVLRDVVMDAYTADSYQLAKKLYISLNGSTVPVDDDVTIVSGYISPAAVLNRELECPCTEASLVLIRTAAEEIVRTMQVSYDVRHAIITALLEALINCILFAYPDKTGNILVRFDCTAERFVVHIHDFGVGFDPDSCLPPDNQSYEGVIRESGRGIFLMKRLMDKMKISSAPGSGTVVTLEKNINDPVRGC